MCALFRLHNVIFAVYLMIFIYAIVVVQLLNCVRLFVTPRTAAARLPCSSLFPGVCSNSCPLSQRCYPTISSSVVPFLLLTSIFPTIRFFSNELAHRIRWPKYWSFSFSISPSTEYSGLISFRIDWSDSHAVQGTLNKHYCWKASVGTQPSL